MMKVREATPEDQNQIVNFQLAMASETENISLDKETVSKGVQAVFNDASKGRYYVAVKDGRVISSLLTTYEWSDWRNGTIWWIQSVYVMPGYRKSGVYKAMYSHLKKRVKADSKVKGLRLYAEKKNITARKVYEKSGMTDDHYVLYEWMNS